ncbi:MAG TPA: glycosyltransferase 87 family protein [Longimicrobiaceae bacterium]|nr:glycosyltransferase 87 family protein [Longimicrobiaceae bacterium]
MSEPQRYLLGAAAVALGVLAVFLDRSGRGRVLLGALVLAAGLYLALLCRDLVPALWLRADRRDDLQRYFVVARRALLGLQLYWPWPDYGPHFATLGHPYPQERFPYPPFLPAALAPLARLPLLAFARAWFVVLYAGLLVYAASLARLATGRISPAGVVVAAAVVAALPGAQLAFMVGNVEPVLWALFGAALAFPAARGPAFAASAMVKLYAAWPLAVAVSREGWRVARGAALAVAVGLAVGCVSLGPARFLGAFLDWARYMLPVVGQGTFATDPVYGGTNLSLSFGVLRLARELGWEYRPGPLPVWARLYLTAVGVAAPLLAARTTRRMREPALRYGLVTVAAVVFAPLCWATYLPLLLAPLAVAVRLGLERRLAPTSSGASGGAAAPGGGRPAGEA